MLISADIRGAYLGLAILVSAGLPNADLGGADVTGANLTGADLSDAILMDAEPHRRDGPNQRPCRTGGSGILALAS